LLKLKLSLLILTLALSPLAAPLLARSHPLIALLVRSFFSRLCHQDPARSFVVDGSPVAVWQSRCYSICSTSPPRPFFGMAIYPCRAFC
jgi:hypothetical protein